MKLFLLCYHKNVYSIYNREWVETFKQSILNQHYQDFEIVEINYGGTEERIFDSSIYESKPMPTFIHAMNYLIEKCLDEGADCVGNLNCDDIYSFAWLETEMPYIEKGIDIVSCNFSLIKDNVQILEHRFDELNIKEELSKNHNPVCHPAVIYSKKFLENNRYVPEEIPLEDLLLWKRTIDKYQFKIVPENLLYHRLHNNAVCQSNNR